MIHIYPIDANDQIIEADLDGQTYYVGLSWNQTAAMWTLSLRNLGGDVLTSSIPAIPFWPLLWQIRNPSLPPGEITIWLREGATLDRQSFVNGDAGIVYWERAEMEAMRQEA